MGDLIPFPGQNAAAAQQPKHSIFPTMFCGGCGHERTTAPGAADPGPCPRCGSTIRTSCKPASGAGVDVRIVGGNFVGPIEVVVPTPTWAAGGNELR